MSMKTRRFIVAAVAALLLAPMGASTALAAPPANDTPSGAIAVGVPSTVVQDTSEATTDALDAALNPVRRPGDERLGLVHLHGRHR